MYQNTHPEQGHYILCHHCDLLVTLPYVQDEHKSVCPRCGSLLTKYQKNSQWHTFIYALCALLMYSIAMAFLFINIRVFGVLNTITIGAIPDVLYFDNYGYLSLLFALFVLILPLVMMIALLILTAPFFVVRPLKRRLLVIYNRISSWSMAEIFLVGVLVSFVKLTSYGDIGINQSFVAYCLFVILQIKAVLMFNEHQAWQHIGPSVFVDKSQLIAGQTGLKQGLRLCRCCHAILPAQQHRCERCHTKGLVRDAKGLQWTLALLVTAVILYIPANLFSIMTTVLLGSSSDSTIMSGVIYMWQSGDYPVALVIFIASIIIPIWKIVALFKLYFFSYSPGKSIASCLKMNRTYNLVEFIGRWSMIDIFVVSVLATLIRNGQMMGVYPNQGALFFATVVMLTMVAALRYDPRFIWDRV